MSNIINNFEITNDFTITDDNIQIKTVSTTGSLDISGNIIIGSSSSDNAKLIIKNTNNSIIELKAKNSNNIETTKSITNKSGVLEFTSNASLNTCLYEFNVDDSDSIGFMNSVGNNKPGIVFGRAGNGSLSVNDYSNAQIFYSTVDGGSVDNALNFTGEKLIFNTSTGNFSTLSQAMIIDASGNVGMGTSTNPTVSLDIGGTDAIRIPVGTGGDEKPSGENGYIRYNTDDNQFEGYGNGNWGSLGGVMSVDQNNKITANNTYGLRFYTTNTTRMQIFNDGNITIANDLGVTGTVEGNILKCQNYIYANSNMIFKAGTTNPANYYFQSNNNQPLVFINGATGDFGIGTQTPSAKLEVSGDAKINGLTLGKGNNNNSNNTVFGYQSLAANTGGTMNTAVGYQSLKDNTNGERNTAVGHTSLSNNAGGVRNTAVGEAAMFYNQSGKNNTAVGWTANFRNTYGDNNTIIGYEAGNSYPATNLTNTTCLGYKAVVSFSNVVRLGNASAKVLIGTSMTTNPTAQLHVDGSAKVTETVTVKKLKFTNTTNDIIIGNDALTNVQSIGSNVAIGSNALKINTGYYNIAIGVDTLKFNIGGNYNVAMGFAALEQNTTGQGNVAIGYHTNKANSLGNYNTCVGYWVLYQNTGHNNTGVGFKACHNNVGGYNNTAIGYSSGPVSSSLTNTTCIGNGAAVSSHNVVRLGNASAKVLIGTNMTTNPTAQLHVDGAVNVTGDITAFYTSSDKRLKTNIKTIENPLQIIKNIRGVRFNWNEKAMEINNSIDLDKIEMGVIAQEIEEYIPEIIKKGLSDYMAVRYEKIAPLLIEGIKAQQTQIDIMKTQIEKQQEQFKEQQEQIDELKELIKKC